MDQNKKTMRHFYCRDSLWEIFEQMANDFDCSIDYLINEAMRSYARTKNYAVSQAPGPQEAPRETLGASLGPPLATSPLYPGGAGGGSRRRPPPPPGGATGGPSSLTRPVQGARSPGGRDAVEPVSGQLLYLIFNNQRIPIDKDQFIIGRGSKSSDLAIKDGNISRKHAAVIRRNAAYYIKDLGSTNGIDYKGMRIDNKRIDEGDVFHLCDYELRFTYRR